ncbi:MAG TPA: hypothetical protein VIH95_09745 [Acidimicrobiales bacterium]
MTSHPAMLADRGPRSRPTETRDESSGRLSVERPFAAPGLILVAAVAIFEGYRWLHLVPDGLLRPTSVAFTLSVVPVTVALTRHVDAPTAAWARITAVVVLVLSLVVAIGHVTAISRVLGVTSLFLAGTLVFLVVASERHRQPPASTD